MKKQIAFATLLAAMSMNANADALLYGTVTGGISDYGDDYDNDTLIGVRVGTGILPLFDIEAGLVDFGDVDESGTTIEASTKYLAVKPTLTLPLLDIYARAGFHQWDLDAGSASDDGTDLMYGFGFDYFLSDYVSLGASYTRYEFEDGELDGYELNATFHLDLL